MAITRKRRAPNPASQEEVSTDSGEIRTPNPASQKEVSTDSGAPSRAPAASACEPYRELIEPAVRLGRNAKIIWQDLVTDHGFGAGYASVKRFVRSLRGAQLPEERVVIETQPGREAQVDYGEGPMVRHPETKKYRRTRLFLLTLGFSRKSVRLLVWKSSSKTWAELHELAFRRLGGVTETVVLDNLKEGVITPDVYDAAINPLYRDVLRHYGAVALPCRVRDPDRKGQVESGIHHTQRALHALRFETLEDAQAYLDRWDERWANTRIHGTTKRQVASMVADEQPHLRPLPVEPFRYYNYGDRVVHMDGCVEIDGAYYHAPPGWLGQSLKTQWDGLRVRPAASRLRGAFARVPRAAPRWSSRPRRRSPEEDAEDHAATSRRARSRRKAPGFITDDSQGFPMCQRRLRQSLPDIFVPMGGEWFLKRAEVTPCS